MAEITIPVSDECAELVPDYSKRDARLMMLHDALNVAVDEFKDVCEEEIGQSASYPIRLLAGLEKIQALVQEVIRVGGHPRNLLGLRAVAEGRGSNGFGALTFERLAERLGVPAGVVVGWEGGKPIPEDYRTRLAEMFGVPVEWLTNEEEGGN